MKKNVVGVMGPLHFIKCTMGKFQCIYIGLYWSHYVNVMDTKVPEQEHFITDITPVKYMEAIQ